MIKFLSFNNPKWGNVSAYDISIKRGTPGSQPLYSVTPNPKETISGDLQNTVSVFLDNSDTSSFTSPYTSDKVNEIMGWSSESFEFDFEFFWDIPIISLES